VAASGSVASMRDRPAHRSPAPAASVAAFWAVVLSRLRDEVEEVAPGDGARR